MNHGLGKDGWPSDATVIKPRDKEIETITHQRDELALENKRLVEALHYGKIYSPKGSVAAVVIDAALATAKT